jgi:hypothetical protein
LLLSYDFFELTIEQMKKCCLLFSCHITTLMIV